MEKAEGQTVKQLRSGELLEVGSSEGLYTKFQINSKQSQKNALPSPIIRMPRSSVLDRVQNFLPKMASANEKLSKELEACPAGIYDIENVEDQEKIIEMDVALVELNSSDSSEEEEESSCDESSGSDEEVTEHNIKLSQKRKRVKIEVLKSNPTLDQS